MPPWRCLTSPGPTWLLALGKLPWQGSCQGRGGRPGKGLAGGVHLALLLFVSLVLPLPWSFCALPSLFCSAILVLLLPPFALLSVAAGVALTARAQVER